MLSIAVLVMLATAVYRGEFVSEADKKAMTENQVAIVKNQREIIELLRQHDLLATTQPVTLTTSQPIIIATQPIRR
jgi:hypothetical protein